MPGCTQILKPVCRHGTLLPGGGTSAACSGRVNAEISIPALTARPPGQPGSPLLPALTRGAQRVLWSLSALFLLSVALRLNGSSVGCLRGATSRWQDLQLADAPSGLLLSTPKMIRSDEWLIWTPAILAQAREAPSFPTTNLSLGPGKTPLLMSIPAWHYTMLLRPQLWGYFLVAGRVRVCLELGG